MSISGNSFAVQISWTNPQYTAGLADPYFCGFKTDFDPSNLFANNPAKRTRDTAAFLAAGGGFTDARVFVPGATDYSDQAASATTSTGLSVVEDINIRSTADSYVDLTFDSQFQGASAKLKMVECQFSKANHMIREVKLDMGNFLDYYGTLLTAEDSGKNVLSVLPGQESTHTFYPDCMMGKFTLGSPRFGIYSIEYYPDYGHPLFGMQRGEMIAWTPTELGPPNTDQTDATNYRNVKGTLLSVNMLFEAYS